MTYFGYFYLLILTDEFNILFSFFYNSTILLFFPFFLSSFPFPNSFTSTSLSLSLNLLYFLEYSLIISPSYPILSPILFLIFSSSYFIYSSISYFNGGILFVVLILKVSAAIILNGSIESLTY